MYKQFTKESRIALAALIKADYKPSACARQLGMNKSSITRELARSTDDDGIYRGAKAHKKYLDHRKRAKEKYRKIVNDTDLQHYIRKKLRKHDSPEQIAGRLGMKNDSCISHESIYQWIFTEEPELTKYLRRISVKGKYRRKRGTKIREQQREEAKVVRIDKRPSVVETRQRIGDYEGDTIVGKDRTKRLLTAVERKSGYGMIDKLDIVTAEIVRNTLKNRFRRIPKTKRHTYTYDNGTEIGKADAELGKDIGMNVYRAYPYHSWERGCNENFNGLVRDFFPKGTDFATLSDKDVRRVERNLNHRPRKRLGYLTPHEVFVLGMKPGAVQT